MLAAGKVLIVGDFNIHVDNEKDALGSTFMIDILNSIGVMNYFTSKIETITFTFVRD